MKFASDNLENLIVDIIDCEHKTAPYVEASDYFVVRTPNVRNGRVVFDEAKYTSKEGFAEWTKRRVPQARDVILTREAPAGEITLVPFDLKLCLGQRMVLLVPNLSKLLPEYLVQYFYGSQIRKIFQNTKIGTTVDRINIADIKKIKIEYPILEEQEKIAKILSTWDEAIEKLEKLIKQKEIQKKSFERRYFFDQAPKETISIGDIFERVNKKNSNLESDNVLTISAQNGLINQKDFFKKSIASKNTSNYYLLKKGDFAYNKSYSSGYPLGAIKPLELYEHGIVSPLYICFCLKQNSLSRVSFFKHFFESGAFDLQIASIAQEGARNHGLLNVSVVDFFHLQIPEYSKSQIDNLSVFFDFVDRDLLLYRKKLNCLKIQKQGLMQQVLTGKKRVKV